MLRSVGGLRANLVGAVVSITAAFVLTLLLIEDPLVESRVEASLTRALDAAVAQARSELAAGADPDSVADSIGARRGLRLSIFDAQGRRMGDTGLNGAALSQPSSSRLAELVERARHGQQVRQRWTEAGQDSSSMHLAVELPDGVVVVAQSSLATSDAIRSTLHELLLLGGGFALLAGLLILFALSRSVVGPASELTQVANALAQGDLEVRTRSRRDDEFGVLGRAMDTMAERLDRQLHKLAAERARLATVLDAMSEAVFVTDSQSRIVLTNAALDALVDGDCIGLTPMEAIRSADLHQAVRKARRGDGAEAEIILTRGDERLTFIAQVAPLPDRAGVVAVLHDVTKARLADRVRRDFVANASHEFRTPLTAIRGFTETLAAGALDDRETAERFLGTIIKHTLRLSRLVDDMLALSRAEAPDEEMALEQVEVGAMARDVALGLEAQARAGDVEITLDGLDDLPTVTTSARALDEILVNLVDNAIKYTPPGGRVCVSGRVEDDAVQIAVHDTGPGIPEAHISRIFERFYRVDEGRSRDVGGTGLGLSIVRHLAARIGAEVEVTSRLGHGTTFCLGLPADIAPELGDPERPKE
ncbi:MAG: HAMP domain-containing protein [Deltaproteobacteria bacterium]|nr:HAMP domain-containing protein [Deltaproteobacteria bacterium]